MNLNSPPNFPIRISLYFGRLKKTGQVNVMASAAGALLIVKKKKTHFARRLNNVKHFSALSYDQNFLSFKKKKMWMFYQVRHSSLALGFAPLFMSQCWKVDSRNTRSSARKYYSVLNSKSLLFFFCLTLTESNLEVALLEEMTKQSGADRTTSVL